MNTSQTKYLNPDSIQKFLDDKAIQVVCLDEIDSTNTEAKRRIAEGLSNRILITAERQSAGRGRTGKSFYSLLDGSVYMTLAGPSDEMVDPARITIAAAVAVAEAVETCTGLHLGIKWVNDLFYLGKKVCGILCETTQRENNKYIIIGIGINIGKYGISKELESIAAVLDLDGLPRETLIAEIINRYEHLLQTSFEDILTSYRARSVLTGKAVYFEREGRIRKATVKDIDDRGRLVVVMEDGQALIICSGEVSISIKNE